MSSQVHYVVDESDQILVSAVEGIKTEHDRDRIKGLVATTGVDTVNEAFTKDALKSMAKDLQEDIKTLDAYFTSGDKDQLERLQEKGGDGTVGNANHNNDPVAKGLYGIGDPRIVPAFKIVDAQYVENPIDGVEAGVQVEAVLNTDGNPDDVSEAIKASIKDGFVDSLSVEYRALEQKQVRMEDGSKVTLIDDAQVRGAALTSRPANPATKITEVDIKSLMGSKSEHISIQTPEYDDVFESGRWDRPDAQDFPDDYNEMNIFLVRREGSDNFSDQSLPVVDMRDGEPTLVSGGLESAHQTAAQVDGLSEDQVEQVRNRIEELYEDEFGVNPFEDDKNIMGDNSGNEVTQEDLEDLKSDFEGRQEDLKARIDELEEKNESLQDDNEDLKSQIEDIETIEELETELEDVKSDLEDVESDVEPIRKKAGSKFDSQLDRHVNNVVQIGGAEKVEDHKSMIASDYDVSEGQVEEALERVTEEGDE